MINGALDEGPIIDQDVDASSIAMHRRSGSRGRDVEHRVLAPDPLSR
jgi:formyltetrahydrofolate hydrolase